MSKEGVGRRGGVGIKVVPYISLSIVFLVFGLFCCVGYLYFIFPVQISSSVVGHLHYACSVYDCGAGLGGYGEGSVGSLGTM